MFFTALILAGCRKDELDNKPMQSIKIAALYSETGEIAYLGLSSRAAIQIAVNEINNDFSQRDIPFRFDLEVYNTQLNPQLALSAMESIANSGCKIVVGPQTSAELEAVKAIADSLGILVISPSSTASSLSIPNDMIFRFAPGDQIAGQALANTMTQQGKQALIAISRNDIGSLGLRNAVTNYFTASGGQVITGDTFDGTTNDFTQVLANVKNQILNLSSTYSSNQIGVITTSFDESISLFNQAASDPVLYGVDWYGGDGFFKNQSLLSNTQASQFAVNSHFFSLGFSLPEGNSSQYTSLISQIYSMSGFEADALTLCSDDIMKVIGKMIEGNCGVPSGAQNLKDKFFDVAIHHNGVTGITALNENGDRENGIFDYWGVQDNGGTFEWYFIGKSE
jgi:branched-chain amino acid transport system substrate-binding protein